MAAQRRLIQRSIGSFAYVDLSETTRRFGSEAAHRPACPERHTTLPTEATGQSPQRNQGGGRPSRPEDIRAGGCPVASALSVTHPHQLHRPAVPPASARAGTPRNTKCRSAESSALAHRELPRRMLWRQNRSRACRAAIDNPKPATCWTDFFAGQQENN